MASIKVRVAFIKVRVALVKVGVAISKVGVALRLAIGVAMMTLLLLFLSSDIINYIR